MALLQTLPPLAGKYRAEQLADIDRTVTEVTARWQRMGVRFDQGWSLIGPTVTALIADTQRGMALRADAYVPALLAATGQDAYVTPVAATNTNSLMGVAGSGLAVSDTLAYAPIRAKQAIARGQTPIQALAAAGDWLGAATTTILADTSRSAESIARYTRDIGYIRMVHGGACGRCVVLAGKWFRVNTGFLRHPKCRCFNIPAAENVAGDWQTDPSEYFHSLTFEQQTKLMGSKANAQAVLDGADLGQIVNAYRRSSGLRFAQESPIKVNAQGDKFTTEGTTTRGLAGMQQRALRRHGPAQLRLMPESIARVAKDADDRIRLLRLYGWIRDDEAIARGRDIFAEQRRVAKNARAVQRRAEKRVEAEAPRASGADGGKPPIKPPQGAAGDIPDPNDRDAFNAYWKARQDALDIDFKGESLEPHEVQFVERFTAAGHRMSWIAKDARHRPTNDFLWLDNGGLAIELKTTKARFATIRGRIRAAVRKAQDQGVSKANFIIDLADQPLTDALRSELASYNASVGKHRIARLWVMSAGRIEEIHLT